MANEKNNRLRKARELMQPLRNRDKETSAGTSLGVRWVSVPCLFVSFKDCNYGCGCVLPRRHMWGNIRPLVPWPPISNILVIGMSVRVRVREWKSTYAMARMSGTWKHWTGHPRPNLHPQLHPRRHFHRTSPVPSQTPSLHCSLCIFSLGLSSPPLSHPLHKNRCVMFRAEFEKASFSTLPMRGKKGRVEGKGAMLSSTLWCLLKVTYPLDGVEGDSEKEKAWWRWNDDDGNDLKNADKSLESAELHCQARSGQVKARVERKTEKCALAHRGIRARNHVHQCESLWPWEKIAMTAAVPHKLEGFSLLLFLIADSLVWREAFFKLKTKHASIITQ